MDGGDQNVDKPKEGEEKDAAKMQLNNTNRPAESGSFTVYVDSGTTVHIRIAPEAEGLPAASWCISTLIIHNGQHYNHTLHNFVHTPGPMQSPPGDNILQQLTMSPLVLHPNPVQVSPPNPIRSLQQTTATVYQRVLVEYYSYMMRSATTLDNVFGWMGLEQSPLLPDILQGSDDEMEPDTLNCRWVPVNNLHQQQYSDSDDQSDEEISSICDEPVGDQQDRDDSRGTGLPDFLDFSYDDSMFRFDSDSTDSTEIRSAMLFGYGECMQQFRSMTSSEVGEEEEEEEEDDYGEEDDDADADDEADVDDEEEESEGQHCAFDMFGITAHMDNQWLDDCLSRLRWIHIHNNWEGSSSGSDGDHVETSYESSSNDDVSWQSSDDYETELSQPLRRLVGELPAITAHQQRQRRYTMDHSVPSSDRVSLPSHIQLRPNVTVSLSQFRRHVTINLDELRPPSRRSYTLNSSSSLATTDVDSPDDADTFLVDSPDEDEEVHYNDQHDNGAGYGDDVKEESDNNMEVPRRPFKFGDSEAMEETENECDCVPDAREAHLGNLRHAFHMDSEGHSLNTLRRPLQGSTFTIGFDSESSDSEDFDLDELPRSQTDFSSFTSDLECMEVNDIEEDRIFLPPEPVPDPELDLDTEEDAMDLDMAVVMDPNEVMPDTLVVPLAELLRETDKLIAELLERL